MRCLKTTNSSLKGKLDDKMQALEVSRVNSYHLSGIYSYWSTCVNTKDFEKESLYENSDDDCCSDDDDLFIDEDLQRHLSTGSSEKNLHHHHVVETSSMKAEAFAITAGTTTTTTTETTKDRRFSDCGMENSIFSEITNLPMLSTQPSVISSSSGSSSSQKNMIIIGGGDDIIRGTCISSSG